MSDDGARDGADVVADAAFGPIPEDWQSGGDGGPGDHDDGGPPAPPEDGEGRRRRPVGCPVVPLGIDGEDARWFVTPSGRLVALKAREHQKLNLMALFDGDDRWLQEWFPSTRVVKGKDGEPDTVEVVGWNAMAAAGWLIRSSVEAGGFNRQKSLRGHGAWRPERDDRAKGLIVHCGDRLLIDGEWRSPGRLGTRIYPTKPPLPAPADKPATVEEGQRVLAYFNAVPFDNPETMPRLALGAMGAAFLVGALKFRPMVHFGGDKGSGKSTVLAFIAKMLSDWAENTADTSEPAVRGMLAGGAKAVLIDEMEPEELKERAQQIVRLARLAWSDTSGGASRGTKDGGYTTTPLQAIFMMASIVPPPMGEADTDRFTYLTQRHISPKPKGWVDAMASEQELLTLGPRIHRRMIDAWPRIQRLMPMIEQALEADHHAGRSPVNLSVLLACAEVLTSDEDPDSMNIGAIVAPFDPLERAERTDDRAGWQRCVDHLLTSPGSDWRDGSRRLVAELVRDEVAELAEGRVETKQDDLRRIGLRVMKLSDKQAPERIRVGQIGLAVSNTARGLENLFAETAWAKGGWVAGLRSVPDALPLSTVRFHTPSRATFIPVDMLGLDPKQGDGQ